MKHVLWVAALLIGCDNFEEVKSQDTIEAYTAYLTENPTSKHAMAAERRIEELTLESAIETATPEAWSTYFQAYPSGQYVERARSTHQSQLYQAAIRNGDEASWLALKSAYPNPGAKILRHMDRALPASRYAPNMAIAPVEITAINISGKADGPKDGKAFVTQVTNEGTKVLEEYWLRVDYLNAAGDSVGHDVWPVVAKKYPGPAREEWKKPMKPGETRLWDWSTDEVPESFAGTVNLTPFLIKFQER